MFKVAKRKKRLIFPFHFGKQAILIEIASENEVVPEKSCSFSETTL